jgi:hypothetical protein
MAPYVVDRPPDGETRKRIVPALGYDIDQVEFAVNDDVVYADNFSTKEESLPG